MDQKLQHLHPALVNRKGPILLHDNARPHVAQSTLKLNELGYETLPHPPYSPDLLPTDYHFFKHLDNFLWEKVFNNQDAAENAFREFIDARTPEFHASGINKLVSRWQKYIDSNGFYFD
jgi:histone-lysine N-methyltransferase SETMAR